MKIRYLSVSIGISILLFVCIQWSGITHYVRKEVQQDKLVVNRLFHDNITDEDLIKEMQATIAADSLMQQEYKQAIKKHHKVVNMGNAMVSDQLKELIKHKVIKKMRRKNMCQLYFGFFRIFSRCPSYYDAVVVAEGGKITNEGFMIANMGCYEKVVGKFRYDLNTQTVEARVSNRIGYIPVDEYIKLYKQAKKSL